MKEMKIERKEKWVQINTIEGYEDVREWYWISNSNEDKIINRNTGKRLKIRVNKKGYKVINLKTKDKKVKSCGVHALKAKAYLFGPNPLGATLVRHLNDVKTDNRLINLAWGTFSDNIQDSIRNNRYNHEAAIKGAVRGGKKTGAKNFIKYAAINGKKTGAKNGKRTSKPIKCIETGIIYTSACEASRHLGIIRNNISSCCNDKCQTAGGYHWEFVDKEVDDKCHGV